MLRRYFMTILKYMFMALGSYIQGLGLMSLILLISEFSMPNINAFGQVVYEIFKDLLKFVLVLPLFGF